MTAAQPRPWAMRGDFLVPVSFAALTSIVFLILSVYSESNGTLHQPLRAESPSLKPIIPIKKRADIAHVLESESLRVGVELGVKKGEFSQEILSRWPSCSKYVLVDLWTPQVNYKDLANVDQKTHDSFLEKSRENLRPFQNKLEVCRNYTSVCVHLYPDNFFDFVYVDARHDYKGVLQDLQLWWPKLKPGGVLGGHDYVTNDEGPKQSGQDWSINYDGSVDPQGRAVKGAVDEFSTAFGRQILVTYQDSGFPSWFLRK